MLDNEKDHLPEEGYQLPEDEGYVAPESSPHAENVFADEGDIAPKKQNVIIGILEKISSAVPKTRNARIVMVVIVVFVIGVVVHLITGDKTVQPVHKKTAIQQPVQHIQPVKVPQVMQTDNQALDSIDSLRAHSTRMKTEVQSLKAQMDDMKSAMAQIQSTNQQLEKALTAVTDQVKSLTVKLNQTIARFSSPKFMGPKLVYHLRAVLPDRAWIVSNQGQTLTVTIGDHVDQYGVVQSINPMQGIITTSSGRKIYYGSNDF